MLNDNISAFNSMEYDNKIKDTLPYYEEFYKQVIDVVDIYHHSYLEWLDVGCGTGKMAEIALNKAKIKKFVFCDNSAEMIQIVRKRFNHKNVEFINSSIHKLNFCDQFDVITAIQVNHYFHEEERIAVIKKYYKALRKNGIFITFENFAPYSELGKSIYLERWKSYQLAQGKSSDECDKHLIRYGKSYFPISISEHLKIIEKCGFRTVEILWLSYMQVGLIGIK